MTYKITTTEPKSRNDELRLDAARRGYEELLRYINSREKTA